MERSSNEKIEISEEMAMNFITEKKFDRYNVRKLEIDSFISIQLYIGRRGKRYYILISGNLKDPETKKSVEKFLEELKT